jgi:uncharacterized protein YjbI with pentapeptide repeats
MGVLRDRFGKDLATYDRLECADLSGKDLRYADLKGRDVSETDFTGSDLRGAQLQGAVVSRRTRFAGCKLDPEGQALVDDLIIQHSARFANQRGVPMTIAEERAAREAAEKKV